MKVPHQFFIQGFQTAFYEELNVPPMLTIRWPLDDTLLIVQFFVHDQAIINLRSFMLETMIKMKS